MHLIPAVVCGLVFWKIEQVLGNKWLSCVPFQSCVKHQEGEQVDCSPSHNGYVGGGRGEAINIKAENTRILSLDPQRKCRCRDPG